MNLPRASITVSPFFGMSVAFSLIALMWSPSMVIAAFGMIFPVPGSMAVPLMMMVVADGVANAVEAVMRARSGNRFIYIMSSDGALPGFNQSSAEREARVRATGKPAVARIPVQRDFAHSAETTMHWKILTVSLALAGSVFAQSPSPSATSKHPFTFEDMMKLKRVGAPVPSPDGKWVVFDAVDVDLQANTKISHLWIVPAAGGDARRLNQTPNHEERPRFSPDGKRLIWTSKATDPTQIWTSNFTPESGGLDGQPHQVTNISTGADGAIWSPDGKNIVFLSSVYPDAKDDAANKQRDEELGKSKVKAKIFTKLLYRHWTSYTEFKRSHLFVVSADGNDSPRDLTSGDHDVPPFNLGGQDMYSISPDGQELAYTSNTDEVEATSTNNEIFLAPMAGPAAAGKKISTSPGNDNTPVYSPDGEHIAWRSMARAGFEADKESLIIYQRKLGQSRNATINFDRSVGSLTWTPDSKAICFTAEDHGEAPIWVLLMDGKPPKQVARLHADDLVFSKDGNSLFFSRVSISGDWGGKPYDDLMKGLDYIEKTYPFIDKTREAAMGASYGGYMANWLLGHTDRFKCIVSHDGVFNTESAYGTTEELWFNEWEFKGPPWKNRELYRKFSPHLFAEKFKTPTLVVHGQLDFRLDVSEGFQLFTTLQRLKVPSKMLYFPDEGHWVLKPQNSRLWYKTVNDWVDQWCKRNTGL